jgi:uncharacterized membrane-anchored protein
VRLKFILVILVQVLVLTGMMGYRYYWVSTGERMILKTVPVDPRSLFRGEYARLRYDISTIDLDETNTAQKFHRNERVYVELHKDEDGTWSAGEVQTEMPGSWPFMQGRVLYYNVHVPKWTVALRDEAGEKHVLKPGWLSMKEGDRAAFCVSEIGSILMQYNLEQGVIPQHWCDNGTVVSGTIDKIKTEYFNQLQIAYGIESYFVEEGLGRKVEQQGRNGKVLVEVALLNDGKVTISRLIFKGPAPLSSDGT